jgi:hypothetical protein
MARVRIYFDLLNWLSAMPHSWVVCRLTVPLILISSWVGHDHLLRQATGVPSALAEAVPPQPAPDTAELTEVTRIDGHDHVLSVIAGSSRVPGRVAVADDGTIAIQQHQERLVRLFDRAGQPMGTVGGWGEGPGEFEHTNRITWSGDTLWVFDTRLDRTTAFSRSGEYLTSFRYMSQTEPGSIDGEVLPGFSSLGLVPWDLSISAVPSLFVSAALARPPAGRFENAVVLLQITAFGEVERLIAYMPGDEADDMYAAPFHYPWLYDLSRRADRAAHARTAPPDGPDAGTVAVTVLRLDGDTVFARRLGFELVRMTAAARDSVLDRIQNPELAQARRSGPIPPFFPPLTGLVVGDDASVWLELRPQEDGQPYLVLDSLGDEVGRVLLPLRSRVAVARLDRLWVVEEDEFGVESVVVYEVAWR